MDELNVADLEAMEDESTMDDLPINGQIQEISKRLNLVTNTLQQQVREKHSSLLQQATHAERFDLALNELDDKIQVVRGSAHRLQSQVDTQYQLIKTQTRVLGRLHELCHLLRCAAIVLSLTEQLKVTKDALRQAELHYELAELVDDEDMQDIEFIRSASNYVTSSRQRLRNLTQMQLVNGLSERKESHVINSLKIFMNFHLLEESLDNMQKTYIADLEQSLRECYAGNDISVMSKADMRKASQRSNNSMFAQRGPGKPPQLTTTQNYRAKFWKSMHWLIYDELYESCEQVFQLCRALEQMNQFKYIGEDDQAIHTRFWKAVLNVLARSFAECQPHVSQTLQEGLSKLITSARGLEKRLGGKFVFDDKIFAPLEAGYVSKVAANMKACLAGVDVPTTETIDNFVQVAATELSAALIDEGLITAVTAAFTACGKELCTKIEAQINLGPDSKQVVDVPNAQQMQNTVLANTVFYYRDSVHRMLQDMREQLRKSQTSAFSDLAKSLEQPDQLIGNILQNIIASIVSTISIIILSMHREPGLLNNDRISAASPSMYIKELQEFIARSWSNHIRCYNDRRTVRKCGLDLAARCIDLFVHNASILRPLSTVGRQRIQTDCAQMEEALVPICGHVSELGRPARLLRAFALLVVHPPKILVEQAAFGPDTIVPGYIVLFLLFGHAGAELQSPHTTANWSNERLIEWLDGHTSDYEKLELIAGALQRYRDNVRRRNSTQYDEVYPIIVDFFEKAKQADRQSSNFQ